MSDILKTIANRIRHHRKSRGLTQVQLSQDSGVEHRHLQKIEAGTVDVRLGTISKIAKSLQVPAGVLLEDYMSHATLQGDGCAKLAVDIMDFPLVVFDTQLVIKYANSAWFRMLEVKPEDVLQKKRINEFMYNSQEAQAAMPVTEELLRTKPEPTPFFIELRTQSGQRVRRQLHWNYVNSETGDIRGFVCVYFDPESRPVAGTFLEIVGDGTNAE